MYRLLAILLLAGSAACAPVPAQTAAQEDMNATRRDYSAARDSARTAFHRDREWTNDLYRPTGYIVPRGFLLRLAIAGEEAYRAQRERFFCLKGEKRGNVTVVTEMEELAPDSTWSETNQYGDTVGMFFDGPPCPAGTVADAHTHPAEWLGAAYPSAEDQAMWDEVDYDLHFLTVRGRNERHEVVIAPVPFYRVPGGFALYMERITF